MIYGITAYNRTVYASPPSAAWATKKPSRATPFVGFFSATFLRLLELLRNSFIATAKTSYTAGTLCESCAKYFIGNKKCAYGAVGKIIM